MRRFPAWLAFALAVLAVAPACAAASAGRGKGNPKAAEHALERAKLLTRGVGVHTGRELSPALSQLFATLPSLTGDDRTTAEALLARPDDGDADPGGTHKWAGPEAVTS